MKTSPAGIGEILASEAIVPFPYRDSVGVWTFGVGHTAPAGAPDPGAMPKGVERPLAEVIAVFRRDLGKYERRVASAVTAELRQHEFDALVSFDFNTGGIGRAEITRRLNAGDRAGAARAFDNWHRPPEIIPRRDRERELFARGAYGSGGKANLYPADQAGRVLWNRGRRIDTGPAIAAIVDANEADAGARRDRNTAAGTGAGGVTSTAGGTAVDVSPGTSGTPDVPAAAPQPGLPDLPADPAAIRDWLIVLGIVLVGIAVLFLVRAARRRRRAVKRNSDAAEAIAIATRFGEALPAEGARQPLGKATGETP